MKSAEVVLLSLSLASFARAEDLQASPNAVHLSLEEALVRARATSARLGSLSALSRAAGEGVRAAQAGRLPELELSAGYTRNSNVPELSIPQPTGPAKVIFPNLPNNWRTHAGATLPIYTGGRVEGQVESAREAERAAQADRASGERDLALETTAAYVNVVFARENARVLKEAIASYEAHLVDARNRKDLGVAASNEVLNVQVERERADLGRIQAENAAGIAAANLLRLVGLPANTSLELDTLAQTADGDPNGAIDDLVKRALEGRAELDALRARIKATEAAVRVANASKQPQAGVQAGFDYADPNTRILPMTATWKSSWSVGVNVAWKVLDGGRASASAAQAQAQAEAMKSQLVDLESRIRLEVTTRKLELDSALAVSAVAKRAIEAATDSVRVTRDRYQQGVALSSDLLDAETRLLRAQLDATQSEAQIQLARANLARAVAR